MQTTKRAARLRGARKTSARDVRRRARSGRDAEVRSSEARRERDAAIAKSDEEETLRASCAATRAEREKERKRKAELIAFRKAHCTAYEGGVAVPGNRLVFDEDGFLRREKGVAVEAYLECPPNGPNGARGRVQIGIRTASNGDPSRIARVRGAATDDACRRFDDAR